MLTCLVFGLLPCAILLVGPLDSCSPIGWTGFDDSISTCLLPAGLQGYRNGFYVAGLVVSNDDWLLAHRSLAACLLGLSLGSIANLAWLQADFPPNRLNA